VTPGDKGASVGVDVVVALASVGKCVGDTGDTGEAGKGVGLSVRYAEAGPTSWIENAHAGSSTT